MKIGWGWKIALLYTVFAVSMITLVIASSRQKFDLVSKDYYKDEIAYQNVMDAAKNGAGLSSPVAIHANGHSVVVEFPNDFTGKTITGSILFYSPVNAAWDKDVKIAAANNVADIPRALLHNTVYKVKINCEVDGKKYYQESELALHN